MDDAAAWVSSVSDPPDRVVHTTVTVEDVDDIWDERPLYHIDNVNSPVSVYFSSPFVLLSLSFFTDFSVFLDDD